MYRPVPDHYSAVSERISNILDIIGYSQADRDRKVCCATGREIFKRMHACLIKDLDMEELYVLGSRGEGSTGPGLQSDQDMLHSTRIMKIVTDLSKCHPLRLNYLMVQDDLTHSGYAKLQRVNILPDNTPVPVFFDERSEMESVDEHSRTVLNNSFFLSNDPKFVVSGPAMHLTSKYKEVSSDTVYALRCTDWPGEAHEWFSRRRLHGWPKARHILKAKKDGCFVAGVGHPHSCEEELEWRISFSLTERRLARSFENTAMKVYILLKMIKKTYIQPHLDDAFSSYHCKVCMMWVREKTPPELWCTENLLYCLILCIKYLYDWATVGYCPDYFTVTNNIYDRKIVKQIQQKLIWILDVILSEDCQFLLGLEYCDLGQLLFNACSRLDITRNISSTNKRDILIRESIADYTFCIGYATECNTQMLRLIPQEYNILIYYIVRLKYALQGAHHTSRIYLHNILMHLLSRLGFHVISVCKENAHSLSQEEADLLVAVAARCISLGISCDASSARLKLCGLGTMLGDYHWTETCLQHLRDNNMRIVFISGFDKGIFLYVPKCNMDLFRIQCLSEGYSMEEMLLNSVSFNVVYLPSETSITPTALRMEMFRSIGAPLELRNRKEHFWYEWAVVDSFICLYFLQYLNFFMLGEKRHQQIAMYNMINVLVTEPKTPHRDTELNLLGHCFMREAMPRNAFICFRESLIARPYHNAAKFYLAIIFQKIRTIRGRRIVVCNSKNCHLP